MKIRPSDRANGLSEDDCDLLDELLAAADRWERIMVSSNRSVEVGHTMTEQEDAARWETVTNHNGRLVRAVRRVRERFERP